MDPWRKLHFQARGLQFYPLRTGLNFVHAFDPGAVATFGGSQGHVVNFGSALYAVPDNIPCAPRESWLASALVHLATLLAAFRAAGASEFVLHMHRRLEGECNEEFTRKELQLLASLDCHLFYVARHQRDSAS
jgi:hypothetical protein